MAEVGHVFVCYAALSLESALRIASHALPREEPKHFLVMFATDVSEAKALGSVSVMSAPPDDYSEWTRPFAIARWFNEALNRIRAEWGPLPVVAYIPHPFEHPGNYFAYQERAALRVELLPDGLINYSHRTLDPESPGRALRYNTRVLLRKLAGLRSSLPYRRLSRGHITQYETLNYARTWHLSEAGLLTRKGTLSAVPLREMLPRNRAHPETRLFLDQELGQVAAPALEQRLRERCIEHLRQGSRLLYKAHPRGKNRALELKNRGIDLHDVSSGFPAERLIGDENVTELIGFYSTPLVILAGDPDLKRTAIFPSRMSTDLVRPDLASEVREALLRSQATVIEVA